MLALMACGGGEATENDGDGSNETSSYGSTYESCSTTSSAIKLIDAEKVPQTKQDIVNELDWNSFTNVHAELTENHKNLRISFTNNPDILGAKVSSYSPTDRCLELNVRNADSELSAGTFTDEELKLGLSRFRNNDGTINTSKIGSNKTQNSITINEINEEHICGSFSIASEDGVAFIEGSFDTKVKMVKF